MTGAMLSNPTDHLWQSTVFALAAALLTLAFRKNRAQIRYWLWLTASLKFLIPFALLMTIGTDAWDALAVRRASAPAAPAALSLAVAQIAQPFSEARPFSGAASVPTHGMNWLLLACIASWACGVFAVAAMRLRGWRRVRAALRASVPIDIFARAAVRVAPGLLEPGVVGIFRQTLLLPEGLLGNLTPPQLQSVFAHEFAHIRRRDNLTAALHMLVEAVFWFHPAVWWIGARLVEERERACDEAVLTLGNEPRDYAEAILGVCKLYVESPLLCVSGVTGADLKRRIHEILGGHVSEDLKFAKKAALALAATTALALPILVGAISAPAIRAQAQPASEERLSFEVASIKPDPDPSHHGGHSIHIHVSGDYYAATGLTAKYLIKDAYSLSSDDQLSGGPDWISSDAYAIDGKIDPALAAKWTSREKQMDIRLMIQSLLADRFKLKISRQTKQLPVFNLVVAKGGPKIALAAKDEEGHSSDDGHNEGLTEIEQYKNQPIQALIDNLSRQPELNGRLVIDKTGLAGSYSFDWRWTRQTNGGDPAGQAPSQSADPPSLWTALQEQLGLKLESGKGPVDTIVIEHIEEPSPN